MSLDITYRCQNCREIKPEGHTGMICPACNGDYRPLGQMFGERPVFDSFYDPILETKCYSYSQQEKAMNEFNNRQKSLPPEKRDRCFSEGLTFAQDNHKFMKKCRNMSRNKKDYVLDRYKKSGKDPATLTPTHKKWFGLDKKKTYFTCIALLISLLVTPNLHARLLGVGHTNLTVNDKTYEVPLYRPSFKQDMYFIKRAIEGGDVIAREIVVGNASEKYIFIGDGETVRWLKMTYDGDEIIEAE